MEQNEIQDVQPSPMSESADPATVAPLWHTIVLVAAIFANSVYGSMRYSQNHGPINRLAVYGITAATELGVLGWVALGLRMRRISFRSLLGPMAWSLRSIAADLGVAFGFWIASLCILGTLNIAWSGVETIVTHRAEVANAAERPLAPSPSQRQTLRTLTALAPANQEEIAAWVLLCGLAGIVEEAVFRSYLQRQFTAWARGGVAAGVVLSALAFGSAHGYEGVRGMFLVAVFGVLFSVLALKRRSLRAGIFAHIWHDLFVGLTLALLKSYRLI